MLRSIVPAGLLASTGLLAPVAAPAAHPFPAPSLVGAAHAQEATGEATQEDTREPTLVIRDARVVDAAAGVLRPADIVVSGRTISALADLGGPLPDGVRVVEAGGRPVIPGLIDAHVHIADLAGARRALESGVTTARSAGVAHFADVGLRELAGRGALEGPELLAAGYHVRPRPADALFLDEPELAELMGRDLRAPADLRRLARVMTARGVDWVKTNATARAGLPETDPREPYYDASQLAALVEAVAEAGVPVMAHAHGDEGGRAAAEAGVRSVEHGTYLTDGTLELMAARGTFLVPTIAVVTDLTQPGGDYDHPFLRVRGRHMLPRVRATAARAHRLGIRVVAATDTGYGPGSTVRLGHELEELVGVGLTPAEALLAATARAAELLGREDRVGRIAPGMEADVVVLDQNPLEDIRAVQDVLVVVADGRVVVDRLVR